jgi:hypothetical protein
VKIVSQNSSGCKKIYSNPEKNRRNAAFGEGIAREKTRNGAKKEQMLKKKNC